jgi:hypothetical protein
MKFLLFMFNLGSMSWNRGWSAHVDKGLKGACLLGVVGNLCQDQPFIDI